MVSCAALSCRNATSGVYKNSSVSFYGFPLQNQALLRRWVQNMGRGLWTPSKYQCLCSEHFEESSFKVDPLKIHKKRRLLKEAAPSKFILGVDGTWLVGTPQGFTDTMGNKTRKRIRNSEPCRVPELFPQWPRLQDWQNEFYKQLLKEKHGSLITMGKDFPVPQSHIPAGGAEQVKDPRNLKGRRTPASLSPGRGGAMIPAAGGTQPHSSSSASPQQSLLAHHTSGQAEPSGSRHHPAAGAGLPAPEGLRRCRPEEAAEPWFICAQCGQSFARHAALLQHQGGHHAEGNPPCAAPPEASPSPAAGTAPRAAAAQNPAPAPGLRYPLRIRIEFGAKAVLPN